MARTTLRLALLVVLAAGITVGTSGFTSVSADRSVSVNVVDDEQAYVGVVACERASNQGADDGKYPVRIWIDNRNTAPMTVESVTAEADGVAVTNPNSADTGPIDPGETARFGLVFTGETNITVTVSGGFEAEISRDVVSKADCPRTGSNGQGNSVGNS